MTDTPKGWRINKLGELLEVQNGYAFDSDSFSTTEGVPLIRIRDLKGGVSTEVFYKGTFEPRFIVGAGDLLIGMDGEFRCYRWKGGDALLNQRVCRLTRCDTATLLPDFLFYGINRYLKKIEDETPYVTVKHLSSKKLNAIEFAFPSLPEQGRIVERIEECMARIEEIEHLRAQTTEEARLVEDAVIDDLVDESWPAVPVSQLVESIRNGWSSKQDRNGVEVRMLRLSCVHSKVVDVGEVKTVTVSSEDQKAFHIVANDIFVVRGNGSARLVGRSAIATNTCPDVIFNDLLIRIRTKPIIRPEFLNLVLHSRSVRKQIQSMAKTAAGIWKINQTGIENIKVPVPSIEDQNTFVEKVREALFTIRESNALLEGQGLPNLRDAILRKAFAGEI